MNLNAQCNHIIYKLLVTLHSLVSSVHKYYGLDKSEEVALPIHHKVRSAVLYSAGYCLLHPSRASV